MIPDPRNKLYCLQLFVGQMCQIQLYSHQGNCPYYYQVSQNTLTNHKLCNYYPICI